MKHNINWYVRCRNCKSEIGYNCPVILDEEKNVFCDEECFMEFHHCYKTVLNDDVVTDERMWNIFDDEN